MSYGIVRVNTGLFQPGVENSQCDKKEYRGKRTPENPGNPVNRMGRAHPVSVLPERVRA